MGNDSKLTAQWGVTAGWLPKGGDSRVAAQGGFTAG